MLEFSKKDVGMNIEIRTGKLSPGDIDKLLSRISYHKVVSWCEETGHNLVTWPDGFACNCEKNEKSNKYIVMLGKDTDNK